MKNKVKRVLAGILLAAVTFTSVAGGSTATVEAKTKRCTDSYVKVGFDGDGYDGKTIKNGRTKNMVMCKGLTSEYYDGFFYPFEVRIRFENHKISASSSKTSVVSVSVKSKNVILNAKKCGTAVITIRSSCGNKFKIKVTVKDHKYVKDDYRIYCKYCKKEINKGVDVTEEEIHQRILNIFGPDERVEEDELEDCVYTGYSCTDWTNWLCKHVWGFEWDSEEYNYRCKGVEDWNKARSGDVIVYPGYHVCVVVENLHNGKLLVSNGSSMEGYIDRWNLVTCDKDHGDAYLTTVYRD